MRRWLSILLLVLLPFQFTWGVAATYCEHETSSEVQHFGHHVHSHAEGAHQAQGKKPSPGDKAKSKFGLDSDCGTCHLSAAKPVSALNVSLADPATQVMSTNADLRFSSQAPDHPERPNWRIA